jgi:hypothetical protein
LIFRQTPCKSKKRNTIANSACVLPADTLLKEVKSGQPVGIGVFTIPTNFHEYKKSFLLQRVFIGKVD